MSVSAAPFRVPRQGHGGSILAERLGVQQYLYY
jgi:hypothetical protein